MILIIDNYGGFTYNLAQLVGATTSEIYVSPPDGFSGGRLKELQPSRIIISSGSKRGKEELINRAIDHAVNKEIPLLGIGLGHQSICRAFGATTKKAKDLRHGKAGVIHVANGCRLFKGLAPLIEAAMYHSLLIDKMSLTQELLIIAEDNEGEIMGVKHKDCEIYGLQFHPESALTPQGPQIINNFLQLGGDIR